MKKYGYIYIKKLQILEGIGIRKTFLLQPLQVLACLGCTGGCRPEAEGCPHAWTTRRPAQPG